MKLKLSALGLVGWFAVAAPGAADIAVDFREGAPKDRFTFRNDGACAISNARLVLDLSGSAAGLIFDVTGAGAGVEVFQPLELVTGAETLQSVPAVRDGDNRIEFAVDALPPGGQIAFTIDVDDTMGGREITVSGSEIQNAQVTLVQGSKSFSGGFGQDARALVETNSCLS
jgi:hypothetical protein